MKNKLVVDTDRERFETRVNTHLEETAPWFVVVGSVGAIFSGQKSSQMIIWVVLEQYD